MSGSLREKVLRLAAENEKLRPKLLRVLEDTGSGLTRAERRRFASLIQAPTVSAPINALPSGTPSSTPIPGLPIVIQQIVNNGPASAAAPPVSSPPPPVSPALPESAPTTAIGVPEGTQNAFNRELAPEMTRLLNMGRSRTEVAQEIRALLQETFGKKDALYNVLVRYQSSYEGNETFRENLERLVETWAQVHGA